MITCILLSDRHCGSGEIIFPKRWGQTKLCDGQLAQHANGRVPFVIMDVSFPNCCDRMLVPLGVRFQGRAGQKEWAVDWSKVDSVVSSSVPGETELGSAGEQPSKG